MIKNLAAIGNPLISKVISEYEFVEGEEFNETDLLETMAHYKLYSLTAPEMDVDAHVFAIGNYTNLQSCGVFYNCRIVFETPSKFETEENVPIFHKTIKVERPAGIKCRFQDSFGKTHTQEFGGLTARLIHRCVEQLNGRNAWLSAPRIDRLRASGFILPN
jgi:peptide deformylase